MFIVVSKYLIPNEFRAMTVFPFVLLKNDFDRENKILINHERIHYRQQKELLILPFYIWYFFDFMIKLSRYKDKNMAYMNVVFEKEAYDNENELNYLKSRTFWGFLKYI